MNKAELIEKISSKTKLTKAQTEIMLDATIDVIKKTVCKGDEVKIVGFGTFSSAERKEKKGRNIKTGETVHIPKTRVPRFKPGKEFKTSIKK